MAKDKASVLLYCDIIHTVKELSNEEAGILFKHYLEYINDLNPTPPDKLTQIVFEPIKQNLKRDLKKWEKKSERNSEIAKEGWTKRKDANASERIKTDAKHADIVTVTVTDTVIDINKEQEIKNSSVWIENVATTLKLSSADVRSKLEYFLNKQKLVEDYFKLKTINEIKSHFVNWLEIQIKNKPKEESKKIPKGLS
jgi:hypothetical protein